MTALPGTKDEWIQIEPTGWVHPSLDGGVLYTDDFDAYWEKRASEAPPRRIVDRRTIIERLAEADLLDLAEAALLAAPVLTRWKWNTAGEGVYFDDAETIAFLKAIGADPDLILAP